MIRFGRFLRSDRLDKVARGRRLHTCSSVRCTGMDATSFYHWCAMGPFSYPCISNCKHFPQLFQAICHRNSGSRLPWLLDRQEEICRACHGSRTFPRVRSGQCGPTRPVNFENIPNPTTTRVCEISKNALTRPNSTREISNTS